MQRRNGLMRAQHGANPEHSIVMRDGRNIDYWLDNLHAYQSRDVPAPERGRADLLALPAPWWDVV